MRWERSSKNLFGHLSFFQDLLKTSLVIFHLQVLRFVSALSKLKAKGRDWKSTLLSEVATITIIWPAPLPILIFIFLATFIATPMVLILIATFREPGRLRVRGGLRPPCPPTGTNIQTRRRKHQRQMELKAQRREVLQQKRHSTGRNSRKKYRAPRI